MDYEQAYRYYRQRLGMTREAARVAALPDTVKVLRWHRNRFLRPSAFEDVPATGSVNYFNYPRSRARRMHDPAAVDTMVRCAVHIATVNEALAPAISRDMKRLYGVELVPLRSGGLARKDETVECLDGGRDHAVRAVPSAVAPGAFYSAAAKRFFVVASRSGRAALRPQGVYMEAASLGYVPLMDVAVQASPDVAPERVHELVRNFLRVGVSRINGMLAEAAAAYVMVPLEETKTARRRNKYSFSSLAARMARINPYHSSYGHLRDPEPPEDSQPTYGFEWEVCLTSARQRLPFIRRVVKALPAPEAVGYFHAERDGSLGSAGVELVSAPRTLSAHLHNLDAMAKADKFFRDDEVSTINRVSTHRRAGLHIHVDKRAFDLRSRGYLYALVFDAHNMEVMQAVAQRSGNGYCRYSDDDYVVVSSGAAYRNSGTFADSRYAVVNVRQQTYEIRCFRGATSVQEIKSALEYVDAMVHYCNTLARAVEAVVGMSGEMHEWQRAVMTGLLAHGQLVKWIQAHPARWPHAVERIAATCDPDMLEQHMSDRMQHYCALGRMQRDHLETVISAIGEHGMDALLLDTLYVGENETVGERQRA